MLNKERHFAEAKRKLEAIGSNDTLAIANEAMAGLMQEIVNKCIGISLQHIETLGLPERQENAVKNLLKRTTWDAIMESQHDGRELIEDTLNHKDGIV